MDDRLFLRKSAERFESTFSSTRKQPTSETNISVISKRVHELNVSGKWRPEGQTTGVGDHNLDHNLTHTHTHTDKQKA